jgi:hypothetical protein
MKKVMVLLVLLLTGPAAGQNLPGVGFNAFVGRPDPWEVAIAKGLIRDVYQELTWQANPLPGDPHYLGGVPGDPDVNRAWMQRYGIPTTKPFAMGAEFEQTLWPRVLAILCTNGELGAGYNCKPTFREVRDASASAPRALICRAFALERSAGYLEEVPYPVFAPELPPGLVLVPGRKQPKEPAGFRVWRNGYGCNFWYLNTLSPASSTPPIDPLPPEEPKLDIPPDEPACPEPRPCPVCPALPPPCEVCPACPTCPAPQVLSEDAQVTLVWLSTAHILTGPGRRARVARLRRELEARGLLERRP